MPIDYKRYCKDWRSRSRFIRFIRAKNKYENCGAINYELHPVTGSKVILTVAHLDHDITNNSFFNLKALCQRCHLQYDALMKARKRIAKKERNQYNLFERKEFPI
ncbi:hypothetical protein LCGC14_2512810 [marine sediment metagenome]|uniref:HNH domain-containing protein n=1 Tax=marine sediment metagenome TaxID=412755 RepID=A0A0F9AZB8_9ZZZZ